MIGLPFESGAAEIDESPRQDETPRQYVSRLAEGKARAAAGRAPSNAIIIAADTTVADADQILGKPADDADAVRMLTQLRGHTHQVYTAIAVLSVPAGTLFTDLCATDVPMRDYSEAELAAYVATGDPLDKAGAYAIQHAGFHPVERLAGCYANVVGLPLCHLTRTLRKLGIEPQADVPQGCQAALGYDCPVYGSILRDARH